MMRGRTPDRAEMLAVVSGMSRREASFSVRLRRSPWAAQKDCPVWIGMEASLVSERLHLPPSLSVMATYKVESLWRPTHLALPLTSCMLSAQGLKLYLSLFLHLS